MVKRKLILSTLLQPYRLFYRPLKPKITRQIWNKNSKWIDYWQVLIDALIFYNRRFITTFQKLLLKNRLYILETKSRIHNYPTFFSARLPPPQKVLPLFNFENYKKAAFDYYIYFSVLIYCLFFSRFYDKWTVKLHPTTDAHKKSQISPSFFLLIRHNFLWWKLLLFSSGMRRSTPGANICTHGWFSER